MNLYELNKAQVNSLPPITSKTKIEDIKKEVAEYFNSDNKYFMLLCRELNDYTVFVTPLGNGGAKVADELFECIFNRGKLMEIHQEQDAYEIWIKNDEDVFAYYLFPYDTGVIECF